MLTRLSLLTLACAGALAACSAPRSPVDPAGNAWVTEQSAQPVRQAPRHGAFGGGMPAKPAATAASAAAPAR